MTPATIDRALTRTFRVGRYTCTVTIPLAGGAAKAEWEPHIPDHLTPCELRAYRLHMLALTREASAEAGRPMVLVDDL